jgi:hypothetical protein
MWDDMEALGDTDQALGMDDSTWSTGIGENYADDLGVVEVALAHEAAPESVAGVPAPDGVDVPVAAVDVSSLPSELTFGAQLTPEDEPTKDSYAEKYAWSTTENAYIGMQTGREIDENTGAEKK